LQSGISKLVYIHEYSDDDGISFLKEHGIEVLRIADENLI
jgi:dCMP deaminase